MLASNVFSISNLLAMAMWALMVFLPKWKGTKLLMDIKLVPILFALLYATYIFKSMASGVSMDFGSLESVMDLFTKEEAVLAGWLHYLAFDLLVGMWILDQNEDIGLHHLIIVPCLLGSFMFGPVGFLLFIILKFIKTKLI